MVRSYQIGACPACGNSEAKLVADAERLKRELESLWQFHLERNRAGVPVRELYDRAYFTQAPPLQLVECSVCETLYRNPREGDVVETYAAEEPRTDVFEQLFQSQRRAYEAQARTLTRLAGKPGAGLELGSYVGAFLAAARARGWDFEGLDVNVAAAAFARSKQFTVHEGTFDSQAGGREYDAIAIWNCFDQLPDPQSTLLQAFDRLRVGGLLGVRVPNGACYARWHNGAGPNRLGRLILAHNNLLGFPYRQGFTPESLCHVVERAGFEVIDLRADSLVPLAGMWTKWWAVYEERLVKALLRRVPVEQAPWFEVYAVKSRSTA